MLEQAQTERRSFPTAGFRLGAYVFPRENGRKCRRLYRRHGLVAQLIQISEQFGRQSV